MGKQVIILISIICIQMATILHAQISHGGKPLPLTMPAMRSAGLFREMPPFDVVEQLRLDSLNESDLKSGFHFAYKFMTDFTPDNSGSWFTQADGTRVWRLGIRSAGAYSINILFSEYQLPEGAQVFLYNPDQSHVLGSFNHLNNSDLNILPVAPVKGDELIIEYQEPANAAFHGKLKIGEVNHDYRNIKAYEPKDDHRLFWCMPPLACVQQDTAKYDDIGRSVVLIVINGETACTGTLINNTQNDGKPYLLTASHCLNNQFRIENPDYEAVAGNIVTFFHYESPLCDPVVRGAEEMSMSSARFRATNEQTDMALLELLETPPAFYRPYYAGWNAKDEGTAPYAGIHHPGASVKRFNTADDVTLETFNIQNTDFIENGHWLIKEWTTGSTAGGSSGSPLFDDNNLVIGALSGGNSTCPRPYNDYYFTLSNSWDVSPEEDKQLKTWLDPAGTNTEQTCQGLDPYLSAPCLRISNIKESGKADRTETTLLPSPATGPAFGNNSLGMNEFAEAYKIIGNALVYGTYIVTPSIENPEDMEVELTIYKGSGKPETLLHTEIFKPAFITLDEEDIFIDSVKPLNRIQETFVTFSEPVEVSGNFFIGYKIRASSDNSAFSAFNLAKGETSKNTTWLRYKDEWIEATEHPAVPMSTALFIDPVIQYNTASANTTVESPHPIRIFTETVSGTIHIIVSESIRHAMYSIVTPDGRTVGKGTLRYGQNIVASPSFQPGIYLVNIRYDNKSFTQKILF